VAEIEFMKKVEVINSGVGERKGFINIQQGFPAVGIKIPKCMIKIEKKVLVGHVAI
jgi:hypothetical protein